MRPKPAVALRALLARAVQLQPLSQARGAREMRPLVHARLLGSVPCELRAVDREEEAGAAGGAEPAVRALVEAWGRENESRLCEPNQGYGYGQSSGCEPKQGYEYGQFVPR